MGCSGNAKDHCCYVNGKRCPHSEDKTVPGRRWACGLMRTLDSWDAVLASPEYRRDVAPHFEPLGMNCKDWPDGTGANYKNCTYCRGAK